jgi:hypothetical protein
MNQHPFVQLLILLIECFGFPAMLALIANKIGRSARVPIPFIRAALKFLPSGFLWAGATLYSWQYPSIAADFVRALIPVTFPLFINRFIFPRTKAER